MNSSLKKPVLSLLDICLLPLVYPSLYLLKFIRARGVRNLPRSRNAFMKVGIYPLQDHYYEPLFKTGHLKGKLAQPRSIPGIDLNETEQIGLLGDLAFKHELMDIPVHSNGSGDIAYYYENKFFGGGDGDFLYNLIRLKKPARIIEIGSGFSTLMAKKALDKNREEGVVCEHICIEPYEAPWLEKTGVHLIREKLEDIDRSIFSQLNENDILFIDSSHMIRPQGDVLIEFLELLPNLNKGVIVHIHDIFTPSDYKEEWIVDEIRMWNEQYLLEAFLISNKDWKIIGALNYLKNHHFDKFKESCNYLDNTMEPGSFYMQRVN